MCRICYWYLKCCLHSWVHHRISNPSLLSVKVSFLNFVHSCYWKLLQLRDWDVFMPVYAEMLTIRKIVFWKYITSLVHNVVGSEDGKCWLWLSNVKKMFIFFCRIYSWKQMQLIFSRRCSRFVIIGLSHIRNSPSVSQMQLLHV